MIKKQYEENLSKAFDIPGAEEAVEYIYRNVIPIMEEAIWKIEEAEDLFNEALSILKADIL